MEKRYGEKMLNSKIIVVTGAESTGKSELTKQLARYFHASFIPEYAREYVEQLHRPYHYHDVEVIARKQVSQLHDLMRMNPPLIIMDTWLIITRIWFEVVFDKTPDWLDEAIRETTIDLFLVCDTDLPWISDPVRENGGDRRSYLQERYIEMIRSYGFRYEKVTGTGEDRFQLAIQLVSGVL